MRGKLSLNKARKLEKAAMSKGVVIYAYNSKFDYVSAARFAAQQVRKYLNLPVTLITDKDTHGFDTVIINPLQVTEKNRGFQNPDGSVTVTAWHNQNRSTVYELSPYEQTLLIDADYFMFNDSLSHIFDTNSEFACFNEINNLAAQNTPVRLSSISISMQWATVVYFTKNELARSVFEFMEAIRDKWEYYSLLYSFNGNLFRNDYALSIALQTLTGFSPSAFDRLPGKLHSLFSNIDILEVRDNGEIVFATQNGISKIKDVNIHVMNKIAMEKFYAK